MGIFTGVADTSNIETYLQHVEYDEVTDFRIRRHSLIYVSHPGTFEPESPTAQTFWTASVHGTGTQTLTWQIEEGTWSLVFMNEDGSRGLNLNASLGVKLPPILSGIALVVLIVGLVLLGVGILMIYLGVRRPKVARVDK